ncbi:MAG: MerR family transcriptional regulator [Chloroflexi bacterium]|nr:MerR family transcriptional regulator [Chloroflexota bacterium]MBM3155142.1 MerR family transcriptional regulator [Chloroflexota bacterium]MBM3166169.1 MerR family transcriptional regulator [Chloroflexota bacterium]MBM3173818.1 MerR family transcriptional regulator [Chloroflexota bacterium]MBM4450414.1 MerR family transcriptional regulator [Chloroflexota bacterium]
MALRDSEPRYVISIAARIVGIETHTLRYYERLGLVQPYRSGGNIRYYSEEDIERLRYIKTLTEDLGLNLAGVEVVTRMAQRMAEMQRQIAEMDSEIERLKGIESGKRQKIHERSK